MSWHAAIAGAPAAEETVPAQRYREIVAFESAAREAEAKPDAVQALALHAKAIDASRDLDRPRLTAVLFYRLGEYLRGIDRVQDAVIAFESGLSTLAAVPDLDIAAVLAQLAGVPKGFPRREVPVALDLYSESVDRDLTVAEADPALVVKLLIGIGNAYLLQSQDGPARNAYDRALTRPEIAQSPLLEAHTLANRGEIQRRQGDAEAARASLMQAIAILDGVGSALEARRALALLAGIERDRGDHARAREHYDRALELYGRAGDAPGEAAARSGLGNLLMAQGRCPDAMVEYERAIALAGEHGSESTLWPAYWGLGTCQRTVGRLDEAAAALARSAQIVRGRQDDLRTDEGKVGLVERAQDVYDELMSVHLERARANAAAYSDALALAEDVRGVALRELMEGWGPELRPPPGAFGLPSCAPGGTGDTVDGRPRRDDVSQMAPATATAPTMVLTPNSAAAPSPEGVELDAPGAAGVAQPPLPRLVYYTLERETAIFAVAADGTMHAHVAAIGAAEVAERVARLRRSLRVDTQARGVRGIEVSGSSAAPAATSYDEDLRALYALLVEPVAQALPAAGATLAIEPHGALWLLPFAALQAVEGEWMGERWALVYAPSARLLDDARRRAAAAPRETPSALVVGNPVASVIAPGRDDLSGLGFAPLPGAGKEAADVGAMFARARRTVLRGSAADLAAVVENAPRYRIVHLATHGLARSDDPLGSFVLLAPAACGELLTARRVMTLRLDADLVTLSACQTGLGRVAADGVIGLSRAFLFAGARSVMVSHWSVDDEATTRLMTGFYRHYLKESAGPAEALRFSMTDLRARRGFEHPRYWAPFFIVGAE